MQAALADFQSAFRIYQRLNEPRSQALALQEIGRIYSDARDYAHVLSYYAQSSEVFSADPQLNLVAHNNRGFALKDLGRLSEAEAEFRKSLAAAIELGSAYVQAHILTNIAYVEEQSGRRDLARATLARGLGLADRDNEAAAERPFLLGMLAKVEADAGHDEAAARLLDQTFQGVDLAASPMDFRDFHEIAARVYERTGDRSRALLHLKAFKRLDDEGRALAASTNSALMAAQFDFANQDLKITRLKAGQLERDVKLARSQARLRVVVLTAALVIGGAIFLATLLGFLSMRASRNRVRAANTELGVANGALGLALKAKSEFLATTSHEIRTPLNGILGMTQVILADLGLARHVRERLQLVHGAGETMKALVDDLLDIAKAETGAVTLEAAPVELPRLLEETRRFWEGQAEAKGLTLVLEAAGAPPRIVADEGRLRQLLFNLMSNALKFTEAGSVTLRAGAEGGALVLAVEDTGIGIPAREHARIFEAFIQVDGGTSRKYGGTGLGLSICRNICSAMGGSVDVASAEGRGSTFTVRLPLVEAARVEPQATPARAARLAAASVLVVEPNPLAQNILKSTLASRAAHLTALGSLEPALAHLAGASVDVVLADAAVFRLGPQAPAEALHALCDAAPGARVVVTCPAAEAALGEALQASGGVEIVWKPVAPAALAAVLEAGWPDAAPSPVLASAA